METKKVCVENLINKHEVAKILGICSGTVLNWALNGKIPSYRVGSGTAIQYIFDREVIEKIEKRPLCAARTASHRRAHQFYEANKDRMDVLIKCLEFGSFEKLWRAMTTFGGNDGK